MQFFQITALVLPLLVGVMAAPAPEANALPAPWREEAAPGQEEFPAAPVAPSGIAARSEMAKRGFGCPFNAYECSDHCRGLGGGRSGGYCGGPWYLGHPTCICVFN
ncbi:hypothetical protein DL95DRAFT_468165 [Leptodontidium sp. 2 PMI_412]|nr:hypothetical protein BKA61DRAFT_662246 [Leptodontidium sp. MPI-SDFR-AT-0119]KAH9207979.1 hypothetical protein DL95DRAFT_468165 [Leptodontidium sp. 2 PMI_412]